MNNDVCLCNYLLVTLCFILTSGHIGWAASDDQGEFSLGAAIGPWGVQQPATPWCQGESVRGCDRGEDQGLHLPEDLQGLLRRAGANSWQRNTGMGSLKGQEDTCVLKHEASLSYCRHQMLYKTGGLTAVERAGEWSLNTCKFYTALDVLVDYFHPSGELEKTLRVKRSPFD